jgi:hypothetical protein
MAVEVSVPLISAIRSMNDAPLEPGWAPRPTDEGPQTVPEPPDRPDEHAQWDEARGRWIVWDRGEGAWVPLPAPDAADDARS